MSINKITLNRVQAQDWYGQQLIASTPSVVESDLPPDWAMLGDYAKSILILIDEPEQAFLQDEDLSLLTGILSACKLNMGDVGIVNLRGRSDSQAAGLQKKFQPSAWWLFGIESARLGLRVRGADHPEGPVFAATQLKQLAKEPEAKRELWRQLKSYYGI